eukprot:COSAG01_NODE_8065_length_2933_cov_26.610092_2_plen_84_part_00
MRCGRHAWALTIHWDFPTHLSYDPLGFSCCLLTAPAGRRRPLGRIALPWWVGGEESNFSFCAAYYIHVELRPACADQGLKCRS